MLERADVERIIENALRDLSISIKDGGFTDPNSRVVELRYKDTVLQKTYFDVVQKDEYEG